ncbi:MAG: sulfate adenylyltransferase, partial [Gammaproteobacteria bacterium]|nr:sulfate adenylyltransferase [Gammaproteobacteria bacterium]
KIMNNYLKIIFTVGPTSLNEQVLRRLEVRNISLVRINLSHVQEDEIEKHIQFLQKFKIPVAIDTEGSQIRTGNCKTSGIFLNLNHFIKLHRNLESCDNGNIYFTPPHILDYFKPGDLIAIDFNSALLRVEDVSSLAALDFITCRVIVEGYVGSKKGVHCEDINCNLPSFSPKDLYAIELAKKYGIKHFTLSFIDHASEVERFKQIYPQAITYAKIETISGVKNVSAILNIADGILIDRGDLSREIPIEKIPLAQKMLIEQARLHKKDVFVASNLVEAMALDLKPTRAEVNDIVNTVLDGATGFVLTKEAAVGRYPVETVNMVNNLISQSKRINGSPSISVKNNLDYLINGDSGFLIAPHGGKLVDGCLIGNIDSEELANSPKLPINKDILMDLEQLAVGTFSPLEGFLTKKDYQGVLDDMRLADGTPWTLPIILPVTQEEKKTLKIGKEIALTSQENGKIYGILELEEIYSFDKEEFAKKIFSTIDSKHPGVQHLEKMGDYLLGGKVRLLCKCDTEFSRLNLTPRQTRRIFESLGWSKVIGFHTRNVIHRSHEYLQLEAMERSGCDGLFVHPVAGKKKKGDYSTEAIVESYEIMMEKYYPKNRVILGVFLTYSRYAGPREAIFTALCRKNFGCSHFIVGRDHTGVGDYYHPKASQEIFSQFDDLGIEPVFFDAVGYSKKLKQYIHSKELDANDLLHISGTQARDMLRQKQLPADWFMRPEISTHIINKLNNGEEIFW